MVLIISPIPRHRYGHFWVLSPGALDAQPVGFLVSTLRRRITTILSNQLSVRTNALGILVRRLRLPFRLYHYQQRHPLLSFVCQRMFHRLTIQMVEIRKIPLSLATPRTTRSKTILSMKELWVVLKNLLCVKSMPSVVVTI